MGLFLTKGKPVKFVFFFQILLWTANLISYNQGSSQFSCTESQQLHIVLNLFPFFFQYTEKTHKSRKKQKK